MENDGLLGFYGIYPLVNSHIVPLNMASTFPESSHEKMVDLSIVILNYQMVNIQIIGFAYSNNKQKS